MFLEVIKKYKWYGVIFLVTLLVVMVIRTFFVQSYTVSSSQMETALFRGDRVLVSKSAYGIRIPMTVLSIPFTFDTFLGMKSYSELIELGYNRIFSEYIDKSDIVLFNNPLETEKPIDKGSLLVSRCVAVAGDTIQIRGYDFIIDDKVYSPSADLLMPFRLKTDDKEYVISTMNLFDIPFRSIKTDSIWDYVSLSNYEVYVLNQKLSDELRLEPDPDLQVSYNLLVPRKGMSVVLTNTNFFLYEKIIKQENSNMEIRNNRIYQDGVPLKSYEFKEDYYWFISDNPEGSTDSRSLGFISEKFIIGKVSFIWFSSGSNGVNWSRIFSKVH